MEALKIRRLNFLAKLLRYEICHSSNKCWVDEIFKGLEHTYDDETSFLPEKDLVRSSLFLSIKWNDARSFWYESKCCFPLDSNDINCSDTFFKDISICSMAVCNEMAATLFALEIIPHLCPNRILWSVSSPWVSSERQVMMAVVRLLPPKAPLNMVVNLDSYCRNMKSKTCGNSKHESWSRKKNKQANQR